MSGECFSGYLLAGQLYCFSPTSGVTSVSTCCQRCCFRKKL